MAGKLANFLGARLAPALLRVFRVDVNEGRDPNAT
jgi:hypothetical protein